MNLRIRNTFPFLAFAILFLFFTLTSCDEKAEKQYPEYITEAGKYRDTSGPINTITIVSDTVLYKHLVPFLQQPDVLGRELPASIMPQSFYAFRNFTPDYFDSKKETRIALVIKKGNPNFISKPSIYAVNQAYMEVYGQTLEDIQKIIFAHKDEILHEMDRANFYFLESKLDSSEYKAELEKMGLYMNIPSPFKKIEEKPDYLWFRKDVVQTFNTRSKTTGSQSSTQELEIFNIQISKGNFPKDSLSVEELKSIVDGYNLNRLKGTNSNNYMQIQKDLFSVNKPFVNGKYIVYNFDGMWEMVNDFFGGSFVGKLILNRETHTFYITTYSFYSPNPDKKRDNVISALTLVSTFNVLKK